MLVSHLKFNVRTKTIYLLGHSLFWLSVSTNFQKSDLFTKFYLGGLGFELTSFGSRQIMYYTSSFLTQTKSFKFEGCCNLLCSRLRSSWHFRRLLERDSPVRHAVPAAHHSHRGHVLSLHNHPHQLRKICQGKVSTQ